MRIKTGRTYNRGRERKLASFHVEAIRTNDRSPIDTVRLQLRGQALGPDDNPDSVWITFDVHDVNLDPMFSTGVDALIEALTKMRSGAK